MSLIERRWKKDGLFGFEATGGLDGWGENRLDPVVTEIRFPPHGVSNEDELHWQFGRLELLGRVVRLFVSGHKSHVSTWDLNKGGHVVVASDCIRGPR